MRAMRVTVTTAFGKIANMECPQDLPLKVSGLFCHPESKFGLKTFTNNIIKCFARMLPTLLVRRSVLIKISVTNYCRTSKLCVGLRFSLIYQLNRLWSSSTVKNARKIKR